MTMTTTTTNKQQQQSEQVYDGVGKDEKEMQKDAMDDGSKNIFQVLLDTMLGS
jgi:hypothetical protein